MELFFTIFLALFLSFIISKLVSLAMAGNRVSDSVSHDTVLEELHFGDRLSVRGFESQRKVECVEAADLDKIDELFEVSSLSHDSMNGDEMSRSLVNLEKSDSEEDFVRKVSESLDDLKKSDGSGFEQVREINIDDSVIEKITHMNDEKVDVKSIDDNTNFSQTIEIMDVESKSKNEDNAQEYLSDDDEWEGIERSEIENDFLVASKFVKSGDIEDRLANLGRDFQMELYALNKVATEGPCRESQPVSLNVSARAKWNAWQRLGNISPDEAMERYISLLSDKFPGWMNSAVSILKGQSSAQPLEAETLGAPASDTRTSLTQPNSSIGSKPELNLGEGDSHVGDLDMKNKVEG